MEAVTGSVIAVLGTLFGAALTHRFQRRATADAVRFARDEQLRQERLDAYARYGGALMNYRRSVMNHWLAQQERRSDEVQEALTQESYRQRTAAQEAMFRVELLSDDPVLIEAGRDALERMSAIRQARSGEDFTQRRNATHALIYEFITSSKAQLSGRDSRT
ncbi:hypothetical protein AB0I22_13630 [Streptomyces sp. NPDC050610]|uniref:hypothetical protein n=1 Tax=Streptomyces sp. NPDC050610 TaxID=3157097 RepID=UPI0034454E96